MGLFRFPVSERVSRRRHSRPTKLLRPAAFYHCGEKPKSHVFRGVAGTACGGANSLCSNYVD